MCNNCGNISEKCKFNYWDSKGFLEYKKVKGELLIFNCSNCVKCWEVKFNTRSTKRYTCKLTCNFFDRDLNEFDLLPRKGVYPYRYMDS